ncbi:MAG: hypothetical protein IT284_02155 [Bacteroidetes bacterium]|nr:hypothetical protein [Bacteroidota bacterium]
MKNIATIVLALVLISGAYFIFKNDKISETENQQVCYIWNTEAGDSAEISMKIDGEEVEGEFNWFPFEKDSKTGTFEGTISRDETGGLIEAMWQSMAEGMTVSEELRIILDGDIAKPGFGMMQDRGDGVYIYGDKENINYGISLQKADCDN